MTAGFQIPPPSTVATFGVLGSGFVDQASSTIAFDEGAQTFTISPAVPGGFTFYVKGVSFTKTAAESIIWPDTEGLWMIYYNAAGVLAMTQSATIIENLIKGDGATVAALYWDAANNRLLRQIEERHNVGFPDNVHWYCHRYLQTMYESGLGLANFTITPGNTNLAASAQFNCGDGAVSDEDLRHPITDGAPQDLAPLLRAPIFYLDGPNPGVWRRKAADTFPVIYSGTAGYVGASGRLPFNTLFGGNWILSEVGNARFVFVHFYATTDALEPIIGIQGQATYANVTAARAAAKTELNDLLGVVSLLSTEKRAIATVIFQTDAAYTNAPKAKVVLTDTSENFVDWRAVAFFSGQPAI